MGTKGAKVPAIKNIPPKTERELKIALDTIKEALEIRLGQRGDPLDRAVTLRELQDANIVKVGNTAVGATDGIKPPDEDPGDLTIPPAPTGLTANGAFTSIVLKWNNPSYGNHAFTEIWRSQDNALGGAELVSTAGGQIYTEEVGYNQTYFYWVRFVSVANVPGPWNDTEGTSAQTAVDVGAVLTTLGENLSNLPGYTTLTNLIDSESAVAARVIKSSSAPTTRADGSALQANDIWYDTDDGQVHTRNGDNDDWVAARDATLVTLFGSTSFTGSTLSAAMATAQGNITTLTSANDSRVSEITELEATLTGFSSSSTVAAGITTEQTARVSGDEANATNITNLTAKVDTKNKTFVGSSQPANNTDNDLQAGDLWVNTGTNNQLYRWDGSSWNVARDTTNDGKATVFTQDNVPTSGVKKGDIWFDTDDENKQYRAAADGSDQVTSGEWELVRDVITQAAVVTEQQARVAGDQAEAQQRQTLEAKVNKKNKTFIQNNAPADNTDNDLRDGDLWIDDNDGNKLYRWDGVNSPNAWDVVRDTTNDGKATVFTQDDVPTSGVKKGDIWFDTNDENKQYRAAADGADQVTSGEWEVVRDVLTQASVTTVQNAVANGTSAEAGFGLSVNANNAIAGMYLMAESDGTLNNNTSSSTILFEADQVVIRNPHGTNVAPFIVLASADSDGNPAGVYIDTAFIKNAAITAAQIGSLSADLVNAVAIDAGSITAGTMSANRISGGVIQSTDLDNGSSTIIHGSVIETGTIDADRITAGQVVVPNDLGQSGSTTIHGDRIATGTIDADKIDVTDLILPIGHNKVTGTAIGNFNHNSMTVREVGSIGTLPGIYDGYVRITGSDTQVKTLSFFIGDGTFGNGSEIDSSAGTYNNAPNSQNLPMADVGGVQYHSNRAEAWAGIARFQTAQATAQLAVTFRKRSNTDRTAKLYILAQGDGGARALESVEYAFTRLAVNEPVPFTFNAQTNRPLNTVTTSNTITLTGAGFTGGTATLTGDSSAQFKKNSGSYQTGNFTVESGDTITVQVTSSSSQTTTVSATVTVRNVSATFNVTTFTAGTPPGSPPPGSPPPSGPGGGPLPE